MSAKHEREDCYVEDVPPEVFYHGLPYQNRNALTIFKIKALVNT